MDKSLCSAQGCGDTDSSQWLYGGKQYCKNHYGTEFLAELRTVYNSWDGTTVPPDRLKYLIGRYYSENEIAFLGKPSLTKAIVHERSHSWIKTSNGVTFTTIRFPVNRKMGYPFCDEVHQTWEFDLNLLSFTFISEEKK